MPAVPLHPLIVHFPLAFAFTMPLIALAVLVCVRQGRLPASAWAFVTALQLFTTITGYASLKTGENDEEPVEKVLGKKLIHQHEERAEMFVALTVAATSLAVATNLVKPAVQGYMMVLSVAVMLLQAGLAWRTGGSGGELVYLHGAAQTHKGALATAPSQQPQAAPATQDEHDYAPEETPQESEESGEEEE